jgi:hypothetical protein
MRGREHSRARDEARPKHRADHRSSHRGRIWSRRSRVAGCTGGSRRFEVLWERSVDAEVNEYGADILLALAVELLELLVPYSFTLEL